jgi:hypothetical protein
MTSLLKRRQKGVRLLDIRLLLVQKHIHRCTHWIYKLMIARNISSVGATPEAFTKEMLDRVVFWKGWTSTWKSVIRNWIVREYGSSESTSSSTNSGIEKDTSVERTLTKLQQVECLGGTTAEKRLGEMKSLQILIVNWQTMNITDGREGKRWSLWRATQSPRIFNTYLPYFRTSDSSN